MRIHGRQQEDHDLSFGAKLTCIAAMSKAFKLAGGTHVNVIHQPSAIFTSSSSTLYIVTIRCICMHALFMDRYVVGSNGAISSTH